MALLRCIRERKKLALVVVAIYGFLCHLAYKHLRQVGRIRTALRTHGSGDGLTLWNDGTRFYLSGVTVHESPEQSRSKAEPLIAIGSGITSRKLRDVTNANVGEKFQFFQTFLPTFCSTASAHFRYAFYLAYDGSDPVFADRRLLDEFLRRFHSSTTSGSCLERGIGANLSLVKCDHSGKPTWAQNDAMLEAYLDHVDYLYRVNDDTRMLTAGWTEKFISTLESYDPPRVGVVGPNHSGGNVGILTYDFVHRTHVDVFGFYYPRLFTDWWGDNWMTRVYKPNRSTKISEVRLAHTLGLGQRYSVRWQVRSQLGDQLTHDIGVVNR